MNATMIATTKFIGGLFYFGEGSTGTITSSYNNFQQCYTTTEGSVFYLNSGAVLSDSHSSYLGNAGLKGVIYCYHCTATFDTSTFSCMISTFGSLLYIDSGSTGN